jgi:hypothetical protein
MADPRKIIQLATSVPKMLEELSRYKQPSKLAAKIAEPSRTQVLPMPNRWFLQPDKYPKQQPLVERVLQANNMDRTDFFSGANVDPKTAKVLDFNVMDDLGVSVNGPRPSMSGVPSGVESFLEVPESTGPLTRSNLVRRGLFKPVGGDPMLNDLSFLATIERSGAGHQYGLGTEYMSPAELTNTMTGENPTLRPHSRGDLFGVGDVVGRIQTPQGRPTDVYESLLVAPKGSDVKGVKLHKAKGGIIGKVVAAAKEMKSLGAMTPKSNLTSAEREANLQRFLDLSSIKDRLYHATRATEGGKGTEALRTLKPSKDGSLGSGVYLTPSTAHASTYSGLPNDEAIEMMRSFSPDMAKQVLDSREQRKILDSQVGGNMLPVHAQIRNPLIIEGAGDPMVEALIKLGMDEGKASKMVERAYEDKGYIGKQVQSRAQAAGYDGLMQYRNGELSEVVPFSSNQVKSAIGNEGTYDISSPELNKKKGGAINLFEGTTERLRRKLKEAGERRTARQEQMTHGPAYDPTERDKIREAVKQMPAVAMTWPYDMVDFGASALANVASKTSPRLSEFVAANLATPFAPSVRERINYGLYGTQPRDQSEMSDPESTNQIYDFLNPLALINPTGAVRGAGRIAARGAKNLAPTAAKFAEDYLMRTGQMLPVIKPPSGNWLPEGTKALESLKPHRYAADDKKMFEAELADLMEQEARTPGRHAARIPVVQGSIAEMDRNIAFNNWIDKQLTRYVKNEMATPKDSIRELAEKGRLHYEPRNLQLSEALDAKRKEFAAANNGRWGYGESPLAQRWEDASDKIINKVPAEVYQRQKKNNYITNKEQGWEFLDKISPETPLYGVNNPSSVFNEGSIDSLGFPHLIDELRNATSPNSGLPRELMLKPESLSKLSVPQAVERVAKINEWRAAQMEAAKKATKEGIPVHKEFPEGYKWMAAPDTVADAKALQYIQDVGCEGGWCTQGENLAKQYGGEGNQLYVLHDPSGKAVTQISVEKNQNPYPVSGEALARLTGAEKAEYREHVMQWRRRNPDVEELTDEHTAQALKEAGVQPQPDRIVEIKGKRNAAPNEEYLPYVQDFVRSGKWSDVGDLQNTGLYRKSDFIDEFNSDQLDSTGIGEYLNINEIKSLREGKPWKPIDTDPELDIDPNLLPPMKRGGPVNQDAMQMAVWNKAIRKQVGGDLTQTEIDAATLPARMNPNLAAQGDMYRANMVPPTSVMDPRYPAWKKSQDAADAVGAVGDLALSAIPLAGPALRGAKAVGRFAGPELARGLENYMVRSGGILPMDTWHGSPHRFPPTAKNPLGEFDPMKIGTGEGAQAYGVGAGYLAEVKDLAKGYAERLSRAQGNPLVVRKDGKIFKEGDQLTSDILDGLKYLEVGKKNAGQFPHNTQYYARIAAEKIPNDAYRARVMNAIDELEGTTHAYEKTKGSLYKVDLPDEQIAKMLDWDKPLSEQHPDVQALFKQDKLGQTVLPNGEKVASNKLSGESLYSAIGEGLGGSRNAASDWLKNAGIPGIRYLDQGSRAGGAGTSNFVVFDPKHMNIVSREKKGGLVNQDAMNIAVWDKAIRKAGGGRMSAAEMALKLIKKGLTSGATPKPPADMSGWASASGRSVDEAKRLFEIAQGNRSEAAQVAAGLYHPIGGGSKLSKPIELMNFKTVKDPTVTGVERRIITPEDVQGGFGIPLVGDRSAGGRLLTEVEGTQFRDPLTLEAGPDYMLTHTIPGSPESTIWRSGKGVITGLKNQIDLANDLNGDFYGVNIVGAPTNVNYNTMVTEAILNQYNPASISKKAKREFLKDIRNYVPNQKEPHRKPGASLTEADLNDVEALRAKMLADGAGPLRKVFVERIGQAPHQAAGFPDVNASRLATTEPLLVDVPTGSAGFTIGKIDPAGRVLESTPRGHKTYSTGLGGEYHGSLANPIDFRDIFQSFADKRRLFGKPEASDLRSFSLGPQIQTFDQEWVDRAMNATGANKPREWKKGGKVQKKAAGGMTSDDLVLEERKL